MRLLNVKPTEPPAEPAGDTSNNERAPGDTATAPNDSPPPAEASTDSSPPKADSSEATEPISEAVEPRSDDNQQKQAEFPPIDPAAGSELNAADKEADAATQDVRLIDFTHQLLNWCTY